MIPKALQSAQRSTDEGERRVSQTKRKRQGKPTHRISEGKKGLLMKNTKGGTEDPKTPPPRPVAKAHSVLLVNQRCVLVR